MNSISLPVIHPGFEKLKNSGRLLHLVAAIVLIAHALSHLNSSYSPVYFWCQLIFALDILLLVFTSRNLPVTMPRMNAFFRFIEFLFFICIGLLLFFETRWIQASFHALLGLLYIYIFYCERRLTSPEAISLHHTGVFIPGIPENRFLLWTEVNQLHAYYDRIEIRTSLHQSIRFDFRQNLSFDELDQIHEFCRHYLGSLPDGCASP